MPKWIGNRIGLGVTFVSDTDASSAIYNLFDQYYGKRIGGWFTSTGLTATGGVISDYVDGSNVYRAHVFTSSGTFEVTEIGTLPANVEYLVVAGGGSGAVGGGGGGGGAGGFRTNLTGHPLAGSAFPVSTSPGSYTVTIGGGGARSNTGTDQNGNNGSNSVFSSITSTGGGRGA